VSERSEYARKSLLPIANVVIGALLGLLALKAMTFYFGPKDVYGEFQFALASVGLVYIFTDLNLGDAHTKRVSEGMPAGDCFVTYGVLRIVSNAVFVLGTFSLLFLYTVVLGRRIEDLTLPTIVAVTFYYVAKSLMSVASATFDAKLMTARSQLGGLVETLVRVALVVLFAVVYASTIPYVGPVRIASGWADWVRAHPAAAIGLAWGAGSLAAAIVLVSYLLRHLERGRFRWSILKSYFSFSLPLFLPNSAALLAFFIDRVVLGVFGTSATTADFSAPRQIVGVIEGMAVAVGVVLFPAISSAVASGDYDATRAMLERSSRYLSLVLLPGIAFLAFFPVPVLNLMASGAYTDDGPVLTILAIMIYFVVLSRPLVNYLMGHGRALDAGRAGLAGALLVILLNVILVPNDIRSLHLKLFGLGAIGSAIATLAGTFVSYLMLVAGARRVAGAGLPAAPGVHLRHLVAALVLGAVVSGVHLATGLTMVRWYSILLYALLGSLAYLATLLLTRELTRVDMEYAREAFHLGEMARYLRAELFGDE
jgi:O-antigen/teichoic acid export membrane protein